MSELEKPKNPKILETPIIKTHHEIGSELKLLMFHEWSESRPSIFITTWTTHL